MERSKLTLDKYAMEARSEWDGLVAVSRCSSFLFERAYMDYHQSRFEDVSLLFRNAKGHLRGILPANLRRAERMVESHGGLTYGGLVLHPEATALEVGEMLAQAAVFYATECGAERWVYKPLPYIYHAYPADDALYWLFRQGAKLTSRAISSAILLDTPLPFSTLRGRKLQKASKSGIEVREHEPQALDEFWKILSEVLQTRHDTAPVHTITEMAYLMDAFPTRIRLATARATDGSLLAGSVIYINAPHVAHAQYIAANVQGRETGALDLLFHCLLGEYAGRCRYFDFGISTEQGGRMLNDGLLFQKEGLGGRAICYDTYELTIGRKNEI
ncbi:MAG: GNAT family N-acetyltransferase [Alloprevotella sp.]|nr:GNAT family N-acetyltransferase [Alloprevotella sp.]